MVNWQRIVFSDFEDDDTIREKLRAHRLTLEEAVECFYNPFQVRRNKQYPDRFQLLGKTNGGRTVKLIFQLKSNRIVRIITGWNI